MTTTTDETQHGDFRTFLAATARLTDEVLIPGEAQLVAEGRVPDEIMSEIRRSGLFGITLPKEFGGSGFSMAQQVLLTMEFTRASVVYRSRFSTNIGLVSQALLNFGSDETKQKVLPQLASGELIASFALTEESAGSDVRGIRTTAVPGPDGWILNGSKRYITNAAWADLLLVFARVPGAGGDGLGAFLIDARSPGVLVRLPERMNGHEAGPIAFIELDGVQAPVDSVVGVPGSGLKVALSGINHARLHVAATAVGQGRRLLEEVARHASSRQQFGRPLIELGAVESLAGVAYARYLGARAFVSDVARKFDPASPDWVSIAAAKHQCTEAVGQIADAAVQILGGEGVVGDHPVPRIWRDVRALRIYEGASQVHESNLARRLVIDLASTPEPFLGVESVA